MALATSYRNGGAKRAKSGCAKAAWRDEARETG
jgi:hypothetical protein